MLDLSAAFDVVNTNLLLGKLDQYGFHEHVVSWFRSYPQGSSKIFNVSCKSCGGICCFANDSTLSVSNKDPVQLQEDINIRYKVISAYMAMNKLFLNSDKTHLLIMTSK